MGFWFFLFLCLPLVDEDKRLLCKSPDGRDWLWEKLGLDLVGKAMLSKSSIQLSTDGWGCTSSLLVVWPEATHPWGLWLKVNGDLQEDLYQRAPPRNTATSIPIPAGSTDWPTPPQETLQHYQVCLVQPPAGPLFPLGLGACKILFVPSKNGVCFPQSSGTL